MNVLKILMVNAVNAIDKEGMLATKFYTEKLKEYGIEANLHVGENVDGNMRLELEWLAGQLVDMSDTNFYLGLNTWCNTMHNIMRKYELDK